MAFSNFCISYAFGAIVSSVKNKEIMLTGEIKATAAS
jgi:hypothetical protein